MHTCVIITSCLKLDTCILLYQNIVDSKITEERYANLPFMSFLPSPPSQKRVSFFFPSSSHKGNSCIKSNKIISNGNDTISISEKDLKRLSR